MKRLKRSHYALIGLALLGLLLAGWNALQFFSTSSRVNEANFTKIKEGMTEAEVYAILGEPLFIGLGPRKMFFPSGSSASGKCVGWYSSHEPWVANDTCILIRFDENGRVERTNLFTGKRSWKERFAKYLPN